LRRARDVVFYVLNDCVTSVSDLLCESKYESRRLL